MKIIAALIIGLFVSLQGSCAENVSAVPFELGPRHFIGNDQIVIERLTASSPKLAVGDTVTVRGKYVLNSDDKAQLCLYLATRDPVGAEPVLSTQKMKVVKGSGSFELSEVITHPGHLHLSFYPIPAGRRLGTVYFGTSQQMHEIANLRMAD